MQPLVGTPLTATLTDPDGGIRDQSWSWQRSPDGSSWTSIANATGGHYVPVDADLNHYLRATVRYTDGHDSGKEAEQVSDHRTATNIDDDPEVEVSFAQPSYRVAEGGAVAVTVELDVDPERTVEIPITRTENGASGGDYSACRPASYSMPASSRRRSPSARTTTRWTTTTKA